jgi:hypothetical protein
MVIATDPVFRIVNSRTLATEDAVVEPETVSDESVSVSAVTRFTFDRDHGMSY